MKKASKVLTLILIVVFAVSVFAGCDLVGRNVSEYRNHEALQVGTQVITVGKLLDTFNSYYNNYYYYISQGYLDASQLLNMVVSSLVQQYMQIDAYVSVESNKQADVTELQKKIPNAEYLNKEEFAYAVKYVNYLAFSAFDQYTEESISAKLDLEEEETEDTSRDFTQYDDWKDAQSYTEYLYKQNFVNEDADEYFEKNYPSLTGLTEGVVYDKYVYDKNSEDVVDRVKSYNDRRSEDEEDELSVQEFVEIQQNTVKQYKETINNNYGTDLDEFLNSQLADMVNSCIIAKWNYQFYKDLEKDPALQTKLQEYYGVLKDKQIADFNINDNFDSFVTSLSSSSNLYEIPEGEEDNYVFVKNILIPFTADQTAKLTDIGNGLGSTDSDKYKQERNKIAATIVAQYFDSDKYTETDEGKAFEEQYFNKDTWFVDRKKKDDKDSLWKTNPDKSVFILDGDKVAINPNGVLGPFFNADGTVNKIGGMEASDVVVELMKRFNTDTAQHTAAYDYVVYVGEDWKDYSHSWVEEFYTAVNEDLVTRSEGVVTLKENGYTLCVSSYGVHIIYLSGNIASKQFVFDFDKRNDTSDPNYTLFKSYFDTMVSNANQTAIEDLQRDKLKGDYTKNIKVFDGFEKFLKDNELEFDFDEFIKDLTSEL